MCVDPVILTARSVHVLDDAQTTPAWLPREHRDRRDRLRRPGDQADFVAARVLARRAVAISAGCDEDEVALAQRCPTCAGVDHGEPSAIATGRAWCVSWSHSGGVVAAAASPRRVAIDVETFAGANFADAGLTDAERERAEVGASPYDDALARWTCKELLVKVGASTLDEVVRTDLGPAAHGWGDWRFGVSYDLELDAVVAVATRDEHCWPDDSHIDDGQVGIGCDR